MKIHLVVEQSATGDPQDARDYKAVYDANRHEFNECLYSFKPPKLVTRSVFRDYLQANQGRLDTARLEVSQD